MLRWIGVPAHARPRHLLCPPLQRPPVPTTVFPAPAHPPARPQAAPIRAAAWLLAAWVWLIALGSACAAGPAAPPAERPAPAALQLDARQPEVPVWPLLRILDVPADRVDAQAARAQLARFSTPATPYQNLGQRPAAVWLHVPIQVGPEAPTRWVVRIEYPALRDVEFALFDAQQRLVQHSRSGAAVPFVERPLPSRALAAELVFTPGQRYDLLIRVHTATAAIVPISLLTWPQFTAVESRDQITFGLMAGLMAFMLIYSATLWSSMRQPGFMAYGVLLVANGSFALGLYGVGAQYLWPLNVWLSSNITVMSSLVVVAANLVFCLSALEVRQHWPRVARWAQASAVAMVIALAGFLAGLLDYRQCAITASSGAVINVALLLPVAIQRWRGHDRAAAFLLLGWLSYAASMIMVAVLLRGLLPATPWTLYGAQLGAIGEMLSWLVVLNLQVDHLRRTAESNQREHDLMQALAHTDPLTGLANRRGLERALAMGIGSVARGDARTPDMALFMLDLDGFKQINDQLGHEAGDEVLTTLARRLRGSTRAGDLVARLGGDEFVVLATSLSSPADAAAVGRKLMAQFEAPILLSGGKLCRVGGTIGYSVARAPVSDVSGWLAEADAAMYAGKHAGKLQLVDHAALAGHHTPPKQATGATAA